MCPNHWRVAPPIPQDLLERFASVLKNGSSTGLIAQLLYNRGVKDLSGVESFLAADERLLHDPLLLPDMEKAVRRICQGIEGGETIAIYGDFDVDGITATTLLVEGLSKLGGRIVPYIPHRTEEGYGLSDAALERLAAQGVNLVVTADCGISAAPEIETANALHMDVVVTDHHNVPSKLPSACAIVDAKRSGSVYPFGDLAAVGVAYKLMQAIYGHLEKGNELENYLELVALGTVADMVTLVDENRYFVKKGLERMRLTERMGLIELSKCAGVPLKSIDEDVIAWYLAPRLNAAGRMDHAGIGLRLLSATTVEEARRLAVVLENKNIERQRMTQSIIEKAREQIVTVGVDCPLIMVGHEDFHSGVVGVAAGKLVEEYSRPVIVYEKGKEWSRGSARSIMKFDIIDSLNQCSDILHRYGGHPMAAGFTVATEYLDKLRDRLVDIASRKLKPQDLYRQIEVDAEINMSMLRGDTFRAIRQLSPFGKGNPYPTFLVKGVSVVECRSVGSGDEHLKFRVKSDGSVWEGISFRNGHLKGAVTPSMDLIFNLSTDTWSGRETLQLNILDFAAAG